MLKTHTTYMTKLDVTIRIVQQIIIDIYHPPYNILHFSKNPVGIKYK